MASIVRNK